MKKFLLFLLTILIGFSTLQVSAQETLTVYNGTNTNNYVPVYGYYADAYLKAEFIMSASELVNMAGGSISAMKFYASTTNVSWGAANFQVFLKEVNDNTISAYFGSSGATEVYNGPLSISNGEMNITFSTPFVYGGGNLLIGIYNTVIGSYVTSIWYGQNASGASIQGYSYSSLAEVSINQQNFLPKTTFTYTSGSGCLPPSNPAVDGVTAYEATLSWTPRDGQTNWEVYCGTGVYDLDQVSWTPVTDTFYTFSNLSPATNYTVYVRTDCGTNVSNPLQVNITTNATCPHVPTSLSVSNITATTANVSWTAGANDNAWEVVVVPANADPESGIPEQTTDNPYTLTNLQDNTQYKVYVRTDCGSGDHSYWSLPKNFTTLPHCSSPRNVTISQITTTSALVSWQSAIYGANSYTVEYSFASEENWTMENVTGTQFMLSDLEPDSTYHVMVYSICDIGTADTVHKNFTTKHCIVGGDLQIGEGTSTSYYVPVNNFYNYSYTQQIFLASEMNGATEITSVSFQYAYGTAMTDKTNVTIYLGHTNKSNFSGTSDYISATGLQAVYTGNLNCQQGWNTFTFTTPFQYNGTDNLVLVVDDNSQDYDGSSYTFNTHSTGSDYRSLYYYSDSDNPTPSNPTNAYSNRMTSRSNVIFGSACDNDATCVNPNVYVVETSNNSVTLDWAPGLTESAWDIQYSVDNTTWNDAGTVNTHPHEVTGLNSDTRYYFHVRSNCGSETTDNWSGATARTACGPITQLPYSNNFDEVVSIDGTNFITCWSRYTTNPDRVVRCYNSATHNNSPYALDFNYSPSCTTAVATPMIDASIPLNTVMVDFWAYSSLGQGWMEVGTMSDPNDFSTYEFYDTVHLNAPSTWENVMISFENYSGTNQYIAFLEINGTSTSYIFDDFTIKYATNCLHPTNLAVDNYEDNTVKLSWTENGNATSWNIEYGPEGFTPGNGTNVSASTNPFTVENLTPTVTYDFYVYSDCSSELSDPFGPVSATPGQYIMSATGNDTLTTCGVMIYDDGGPSGNYSTDCNSTLVLYPTNPGEVMMITGTNTSEANTYYGTCYDELQIYDGAGTNGTPLVSSCGENETISVISTTGPLTIVFTSDGSVTKSGFELLAQCVSCLPPTNVTSSNPTTDGATVTWSGNGDSYVLFLNGNMNTVYPANDTTYTFTGLSSSTLYSVQVASVCNGDTSILSAAASFATACDAFPITESTPWVENFENYQSSQFICWDVMSTFTADNGTFPMVYNHAPACHSGTKSAEFKGNALMVALPEFTNNLSELRLSFWGTKVGGNSARLEIGYVTDVNDTSSFVFVENAGTPGDRGPNNASVGSYGNYMGTFDFNGITAPAGARIALRYTDNAASHTGSMSYNLDDFTVELLPDCPSPVKTSVRASNIGGHVATITWIDNDNTHTAWTVYYKASTDSVWSTEPASDTVVTLTGLNPQTTYDVKVATNCNTPTDNPDFTHIIHFTTTVACPAPTGLTLANVSTDEATITWNGTANSYNVEYGVYGFTPGTGTPDVANTESYTLTNLAPCTRYTIYVNSDCTDANDSLSTTVSFSFTTTQVPAELPYTADFTATNEWLLNNGSCSNYWTTGTVNSTPSLFVTNNGTTPGYTNNNSVISAEKLLTVGDNASFTITFDVYAGGETSCDYLKAYFAPAESEYPATTSSTVPAYGTYTYSTNAINFENYQAQTSGTTSYIYKLNQTNDTLHVTAEMPNPYTNATSTSTAKLVFLWRNDGSVSNQPGAIISNVTVSVTTCPTPTALAVSNITSNSVDVSWTAGDIETEWEVEYGTHGFAHGNGTIEPVSSTPSITLTPLAPGTTYDVYVRALCNTDDTSSWVGPVTMSPGAYNMTNGTHSITTCELTIYDDGGAIGDYSSNCESYLTINPETPGSLISIQGTLYTEDCCDYMEIYDGANTSGTLLGTFRNNVTVPELVSTTGPITLHFHSDQSVVYSGFALTVGCVSNTCPAPTNFTVSNIGTSTADLSWTPAGSESSWVVEYKEASSATWIEVPVSTPSYQLTGLTALTTYNVRVKAVCTSDDASMYRNATFMTNACEATDQCTYTFILGDGYGDGWNSSYLTVEQNGTTIATMEATDYNLDYTQTYDTVTLNLCDNISTSLIWHSLGSFDSEASITLNGPDGTQVYTASSLSNSGGTLHTFTTDCSGFGPVITDPTVATNAATAVAQTTATLNGAITNPDNATITACGFEWKAVSDADYTVVTLPSVTATMTHNLTGLTANTAYTYKAFITYNGVKIYGNDVPFTTLEQGVEPCAAPTGLTVTPAITSATVTWTPGGSEAAWIVQYKLQDASQWQDATVQQPSFEIEGLTAESTYDVRVKAVCAADNMSDPVSTTFTTLPVGIDNITLANSINLMPNPADNYIELRVNSNVNVKEAVVYNAFGQVLQTIQLSDNRARIDLSEMASGMYFVRVNGEGVSATKKFIKR